MPEPAAILDAAFQRVSANLQQPIVVDVQISQRAEYVCKNLGNRAGARLLMACLLAKIHVPTVDVRKPYCIGFVRHYLHLFHRLRADFLEAYQSLILAEPESSVSQPIKEAFLSMRQAAESD